MGARKIKRNPELLIINPGNTQKAKAAVWRKLRKHYPPEVAVDSYCKIYPGAVKKIKRNRGGKVDKTSPGYKQAAKLFKKFHGREPDEVFEIDLPQLGDHEEDLFFVVLGTAPAESYDANGTIKNSSKEGSVYVHPYEGQPPLKAVSSDGKLIVTVPGKHKVTDWIRG